MDRPFCLDTEFAFLERSHECRHQLAGTEPHQAHAHTCTDNGCQQGHDITGGDLSTQCSDQSGNVDNSRSSRSTILLSLKFRGGRGKGLSAWVRGLDSNQERRITRPVCYRYTTPQYKAGKTCNHSAVYGLTPRVFLM